MTSNTERFEIISTVNGIQKAMDETLGAQTVVEKTSGLDNFDTYEEQEVQQMIRNYINLTLNHLIKLRTRLNTFVPINKLPSELLSYIMLFLGLSLYSSRRLYVPYTRVCRHWRLVLVQEPRIWASFQFGPTGDLVHPSFPQFIERSRAAELNITVVHSCRSTPELEDFFAVESNRIRRLWLLADVIDLLSGKRFHSLREVVYNASLLQLLPLLAASDCLETLGGVLREIPQIDAINQLSLVFSRIRNLYLDISKNVTPFILDLLNNCVKLQNLRLGVDTAISVQPDSSRQTILPELEFLSIDCLHILEHVRAPKISAIHTNFCTPSTKPILEEFDLSSIRYLYISGYGGSCLMTMMGLKQPHSQPLSSARKITEWIQSLKKEIFLTNDYPQFGPYFPRSCFYLEIEYNAAFVRTSLSQMTSLLQLYIFIEGFNGRRYVDTIITQVPSIEEVVVVAEELMTFIRCLSDPSFCPRLKNLTYRAPIFPQKLDEEGGKFLAECLRFRHKVHGPVLTRVVFDVCPPLSDVWLTEIKELGTIVVTKEREHRYTIDIVM